MIKKIAIIGVNKHDRIILSQALSYLTGYEVIRQTTYSIQAIKYGFKNELAKCNWEELFLYFLSSFSERIVMEQKFSQYVSNGSVFNELADIEAFVNLSISNKRENTEQKNMIAGVKRILTEYAETEYDCIIHSRIYYPKDGDELLVNIENNLIKLTKNCKKVYQINNNSISTDLLEKIITNPKISPKSALKIAKSEYL